MKSSYLLLTLFIAASFTYISFRTNFVNKNPGEDERFSGAMQSLDFWTVQRAYPNKYIHDNAFYKAYESASIKLAKSNVLSCLLKNGSNVGSIS